MIPLILITIISWDYFYSSSITNFFSRRVSQSDWIFHIKLSYIRIPANIPAAAYSGQSGLIPTIG